MSGVCVCKFSELHFHTANRGNGRFRRGFCPLRGRGFGVKKSRFLLGCLTEKVVASSGIFLGDRQYSVYF